MQLTYSILADIVVLAHALFILFVVSGGLFALKWPKIAYGHIPAALWGVYIEFTGRICPLTPLEIKWRLAAGQEAYQGDFVGRYLLPIIYPADLTRDIQVTLGAVVLILNIGVYSWLMLKRRHRKR